MNLESLKQHVRKATAAEWHGVTIYLRKIGATDGLAMLAKIKTLAADSLDESRDREETLDYYARAIAKSLSDENGELLLDSEDGIATLKEMNFGELVELGEIVLKHSGFWAKDEKKSPKPSCLDSDSAPSSADGPTPTISTLS